MGSSSLIFLSSLPFVLFLGIFLFHMRRGKSILHDLRGPESKSFWLGAVPLFSTGTCQLTDGAQAINQNTYIRRKQANQSSSGCVNTAQLGASEDVWG